MGSLSRSEDRVDSHLYPSAEEEELAQEMASAVEGRRDICKSEREFAHSSRKESNHGQHLLCCNEIQDIVQVQISQTIWT